MEVCTNWSGRQVCVTGGSGFLGYHLVLQLREAGARVRVFGLRPSQHHPILRRDDVERIDGDLRDAGLVRHALAGCEVIFHTAAQVIAARSAFADLQDGHIRGIQNVLLHAPANARIVHTSSQVVLGASRDRILRTEETEHAPLDLDAPYVRAKRAAEMIALEAAARGQDIVVVNPGHLIGPEDYGMSAVGQLCVRAWRGRVPIAASGGANFVDVRDVARGHLLAAISGRAGRRYLLGGENHSHRKFLAMLACAAGLSPRAIPIAPYWLIHLIARVADWRATRSGRTPFPDLQNVRMHRLYWYCASDRARNELGYSSRPVSESLHEAFDWYHSRHRCRLRPLQRWWYRVGEHPPAILKAA